MKLKFECCLLGPGANKDHNPQALIRNVGSRQEQTFPPGKAFVAGNHHFAFKRKTIHRAKILKNKIQFYTACTAKKKCPKLQH